MFGKSKLWLCELLALEQIANNHEYDTVQGVHYDATIMKLIDEGYIYPGRKLTEKGKKTLASFQST